MDDAGSSLDGNRAARQAVLARVRTALRKSAPDPRAKSSAEAYIAAHAHGPRPAMPQDRRARFISRATDMASTVDSVATLADVPGAARRYLDTLGADVPRTGVCWLEFADLNWAAAGLSIVPRAAGGDDRLGISGCFCAIAETGTILIASSAATPTATALLPDTHIAIVRANRIVSGLEEAFALVRAELGALPRALNFISGPSRTGDIEQTIVLGAHGPFRMHVVVVD